VGAEHAQAAVTDVVIGKDDGAGRLGLAPAFGTHMFPHACGFAAALPPAGAWFAP
jgi:hypothetical protein